MNAALHENQMTCYEQTYNGQKVFEITGESVVSDRLPDIGLVGETNARILLRSKRTQSGGGTMEGDLLAGVCYIPDGAGGLRLLELTIPWQVQFDSAEITDDAVAVGEVRICGIETRMLNPRKVLVKAQVQADFTCYEKHMVTVCDDVEEASQVQVRAETLSCSTIATVCEKTFVVTDEYPLPADVTGGTVLHQAVQFRVDDVKTLMNKLIVKGTVFSDVVIAGENGAGEKVSFTGGFSLIAETDCEAVGTDVKAVLMPTAVYYEISPGSSVLQMEVHGLCQMVAYTDCTLTYLSDAYSNFGDTQASYRPMTVYCDTKSTVRRESVSGVLPTRGQVARIVFMTAVPLTPVCNGQVSRVPVQISACVQNEGGALDWVKRQETLELHLKESEQICMVRTCELHGLPTAGGIEFRLTMDVEVREERVEVLQTLSAIELEEDAERHQYRPSLVVVRAEGDLWDLARTYGSTVDLIRRYNHLEEDEWSDRRLLLIPRQNKP